VLSYNLLLKLLLKHKSHNNSLPELLLIITLTNTSNIIRTRQIKHIKNKAKAIIITEVFREVSEAVVTSKAVTVSREV
jgi:uncharacterized protein with ParB-like and HNH nuclease domain